MAYAKYDAILERVRELLEDGLGSIRTITSTRFRGGLHDGLPHETQTRLGVEAQKPIEATIVESGPHPQRLVITGTVQIERFVLEIKVVRTLATESQLTDSLRDDVKALAAEDGNAICQVLEWPPNLATTAGGTSTDCKALIHEKSSARYVPGKAGGAIALVTVHRFVGTALSRPAAA